MFEPWYIAPIAALISVVVGLYFYRYVENKTAEPKKCGKSPKPSESELVRS